MKNSRSNKLKGIFSGYSQQPTPFVGYAILVGIFLALFVGFLWLVNYLNLSIPNVSIGELILLAVASHKLSRLIAKDWITSFIRAPFAQYQSASGTSEVNEQPRGIGLRLAIGQLITCPFCIGQWVIAILFYSFVFWPTITLFVAVIFVALTISDFLQLVFSAFKIKIEG